MEKIHTCLPSVGIIVLNWNGKKDTLETLESLRKVTYPRFHTIVVDNGSTDGSQQDIREQHPEIILIETGRNLGFARGNNIGIQHALAEEVDAVLLLNNDVEVAPDFLSHLVNSLYSSPDIGAVNPKIYYHSEPNVIWSAGGTIDYRNCTTHQRFIDEQDTGQADTGGDIDFAIGCAVLVKRETIERAGMLDPDFFLYYEETEWCHRIRKAGFRITYVPESKIWHKVSRGLAGNPGLSLYYFSRNRLLFGKKCGLGLLHSLRITAFGLGRVLAGYLFHRKMKHSRIIWKAITDFYLGRSGEARI